MAAFGRYLYNFFLGPLPPVETRSNGDPETTFTPYEAYSPDRYQPSVHDVLTAKADIFKKTGLPFELIDTIIDFAEYWPHTTTYRRRPPAVRSGGEKENQFIIRSCPIGFIPESNDDLKYRLIDEYCKTLHAPQPEPWPESKEVPGDATAKVLEDWARISQPRTEHPCRRIVFTFVSHDQGWGGGAAAKEGYEGSYTWFDVGKEELTVFREGSESEAPQPQFHSEVNNEQDASSKGKENTDSDLLICAFRTIAPTVEEVEWEPRPQLHLATLESDSESEDGNEVQNSGLILQPRSAAPKPNREYRFHHGLLPSDQTIQKNRTAERKFKKHVVTWSYDDNINAESIEGDSLSDSGRGRASGDGKYVRSLKIGDTVTVWGKARFPGWVNVIDEVKIDVYWVV